MKEQEKIDQEARLAEWERTQAEMNKQAELARQAADEEAKRLRAEQHAEEDRLRKE